MKRLAFFLVGVALAGLMLLPQLAHAATNMTPGIEGLGGGAYKPLSIPSLAGNNFSATGKVLINGRWINIPGYIPPASTAAQSARSSLWANPWLIGAALLAWADDAGLGSDGVGGWQKTNSPPATAPWTQPTFPPSPDGVVQAMARRSNQGCPSNGYQETAQACITGYAAQGGDCTCCIEYPEHYNTSNQLVPRQPIGAYSELPDPPVYSSYPTLSGCPAGYSGKPCVLVDPSKVEGTTAPATQADFDALPAPSPEVYRELAPQVGVPVDAPVYEPATVPVGDPYTKPDGSTAQPMAQISPASNGQVTVDVYEMPLTDPQGNPVNDPQPQDTPEPQPTDCDKYPTSVGCTDLGTPPLGEDMPHTEQPITFTPVPISANATCPAPITVNGFGQTLTIDYSSACTYASGLRPIVIAIGYLTALFIIFGVPRSAQS